MVGQTLSHYEILAKIGSGGIEYYQRLVDYWGDGDIDRERIADAKGEI